MTNKLSVFDFHLGKTVELPFVEVLFGLERELPVDLAGFRQWNLLQRKNDFPIHRMHDIQPL